jgi:hypothetical protein
MPERFTAGFLVTVGALVLLTAGRDYFTATVGAVVLVAGLILPFIPRLDPDVGRDRHLQPSDLVPARYRRRTQESRTIADELIGLGRPADGARMDRAAESVGRRDDRVLPALWDGDGRALPEGPD